MKYKRIKAFDLVITHTSGEYTRKLLRDKKGDYIQTMKEAETRRDYYLKNGISDQNIDIAPESIKKIDIQEHDIDVPIEQFPEV